MKKNSGIGVFIEIRVTEQFNSHDLIFKGRARADSQREKRELLRALGAKGFSLVE